MRDWSIQDIDTIYTSQQSAVNYWLGDKSAAFRFSHVQLYTKTNNVQCSPVVACLVRTVQITYDYINAACIIYV